jgi:prevent-host-death family protein
MQISITKARNNLSHWLKEAEDKPVVITRRGRPVAALVSCAEYQDLRRVRAWLEMMQLSQDLSQSGVTATELLGWSQDELENRP